MIGVPIVNIQGFYRGTRYLPDRRDLNRYFPGNPRGSAATRIAHSFFTRGRPPLLRLDRPAHRLAQSDEPAAGTRRSALPQVARMTQAFGATVVLHSVGDRGSLRRAASEAGIPSVTFEMGEPMRVQPEQVEHGAKAIETLLYSLGMTRQRRYWGDPEPVYYASKWVRVDHGGILFSDVALGERVSEGELLGVVTDPISNQQHRIYAPISGRMLGMALNQVVLPGFAAYRIGTATSKSGAPTQSSEDPGEDAAGRRGAARGTGNLAARLNLHRKDTWTSSLSEIFCCAQCSRWRWCCSPSTRAATRSCTWFSRASRRSRRSKRCLASLLLIGWFVFLSATLRSIGVLGMVLVLALFAALVWLDRFVGLADAGEHRVRSCGSVSSCSH